MSDADKTIDEAQRLANTPTDVTQLYPHERMLMQAIGETGHYAQLRDVELISGLERVTAFLKYQLALAHEAKKGQAKN